MSRPAKRTPERKLQVVLSVLRGEVSVVEAARREVFVDPPVRPNRVWQADFSTFETTSEGTWQLCGVVDYAAKVALACPVLTQDTSTTVNNTQTTRPTLKPNSLRETRGGSPFGV